MTFNNGANSPRLLKDPVKPPCLSWFLLDGLEALSGVERPQRG